MRFIVAIAVGVLAVLLSAGAEGGHGDRTLVLDPTYVKAQFDKGRKFATVDLRPIDDYRQGHLPRAQSIPINELATRFEEIPRVDLVVLYCECPIREVERAYVFLRGQSFRNLSVMNEGFEGWVNRGYPVER